MFIVNFSLSLSLSLSLSFSENSIYIMRAFHTYLCCTSLLCVQVGDDESRKKFIQPIGAESSSLEQQAYIDLILNRCGYKLLTRLDTLGVQCLLQPVGSIYNCSLTAYFPTKIAILDPHCESPTHSCYFL